MLSLPSSLVCRILCDWIEIRDVPRFDSSCCSHSQRRLLLDIYGSEEFILGIAEQNDLLRWVFTRGTKVSGLLLSRVYLTLNAEMVLGYLRKNAASIRLLCINFITVPESIALFHNLRFLKYVYSNIDFKPYLLTLLRNNPCLEHIDFHTDRLPFTPNDLDDIRLPQLKALAYYAQIGLERCLLPLHTGSLLKLHINGGLIGPSKLPDFLPEVARRCPKLHTLSLYQHFSIIIVSCWQNITVP